MNMQQLLTVAAMPCMVNCRHHFARIQTTDGEQQSWGAGICTRSQGCGQPHHTHVLGRGGSGGSGNCDKDVHRVAYTGMLFWGSDAAAAPVHLLQPLNAAAPHGKLHG